MRLTPHLERPVDHRHAGALIGLAVHFDETVLAHAHAAEVSARVVVIGDSWSAGLGLDRPVQSWPSRLPGRVHVAGFSGSGFSAKASPCGRVSFADRAPAALGGGADLVVIEGGLNDYDRSRAEIKAGFARVVRAASA